MTTHQVSGADVKGIAYDIGTVCDKKKARRSTIVEYFGVQDGVIADVRYYQLQTKCRNIRLTII